MKRRLFAVLLMVICGCQPPYNATEEKPYENWSEWTDGQLVSINNDSLAILKIIKYKTKTWYEWGFEGSKKHSEITDSHTGLFLVNYRNKQKPLLGDTLAYDLIVANEYHKDSSVLVFDKNNNKFGFWKIGTKSIEFNNYDNSENFYLSHISFIARPWINGNILLKPTNEYKEHYQWSVLNTETGQIKSFVLSGEYEWLSNCMEISYIGNKITCIRRVDFNDVNSKFELAANATITDTIIPGYWGIIYWYGNYLKDNRYGSRPGHRDGDRGEISKIDTSNFKIDETFVSMRIETVQRGDKYMTYVIFYYSDDFTIMYSAKDLIGAGN